MLDVESPTIDIDFTQFLKQRTVLIEGAMSEKNIALLEDIMASDQLNLAQLKAFRARVEDYLVNLAKVIKYDGIVGREKI
jgi:hypothetical protein